MAAERGIGRRVANADLDCRRATPSHVHVLLPRDALTVTLDSCVFLNEKTWLPLAVMNASPRYVARPQTAIDAYFHDLHFHQCAFVPGDHCSVKASTRHPRITVLPSPFIRTSTPFPEPSPPATPLHQTKLVTSRDDRPPSLPARHGCGIRAAAAVILPIRLGTIRHRNRMLCVQHELWIAPSTCVHCGPTTTSTNDSVNTFSIYAALLGVSVPHPCTSPYAMPVHVRRSFLAMRRPRRCPVPRRGGFCGVVSLGSVGK